MNLTKHLRVIPNAWHFWCLSLGFVFTVVNLSVVVALLTP
nr:DUF3265 domain-containing protein [Vibrio parahaemolyticus]